MTFFNLPDKPQSPGEFLSRSLGQGIGGGLTQQLETARQHKEQEFQKQLTAKELGTLQDRLKALGPDASAFDKYATIAASSASDATKKSLVESLQFEGAKDFANKIRSQEGDMDEADILEGMSLGYIPPGAGVELLRGKTGTREREGAAKIYTPAFQETNKAGKAAREGIATVRRQKELLKNKKNWGVLDWDNLVSKFGIPGAASPEAQEFQAATLGYLTGEKARFGVRLSDADLKLIQNKLPDIARTREGNEAILNLKESEYLFHQLESQAQQNVIKRNKGFTYDFQEQVDQELENIIEQKPEIQRLYTQSAEELKRLAGEGTEQPEKAEFSLEQLPPASQYKDQYAEDEKGQVYKSNGKSWRKV